MMKDFLEAKYSNKDRRKILNFMKNKLMCIFIF